MPASDAPAPVPGADGVVRAAPVWGAAGTAIRAAAGPMVRDRACAAACPGARADGARCDSRAEEAVPRASALGRLEAAAPAFGRRAGGAGAAAAAFAGALAAAAGSLRIGAAASERTAGSGTICRTCSARLPPADAAPRSSARHSASAFQCAAATASTSSAS
ncbi:MAG TPA: hypothetical protein PLO07_17905, partial [Rubrivivax sp.]|nr:hypothetical protein [Rubrivivax sp.]